MVPRGSASIGKKRFVVSAGDESRDQLGFILQLPEQEVGA
jgi:hypothetical protein